jgi:small subunit ribosomal protein S20
VALKEATPVVDAMARKGIIHKNKAARHKSRLNKRIKALAAK